MIVLFTDFGAQGPYLGQVRAVLYAAAPGVPVIDLVSDLAPFDPCSAAYLLPAYAAPPFPENAVFLGVVDPGVGTDRAAVVVRAGGYWFVGPDNGLFSVVVGRAEAGAEAGAGAQGGRAWRILWRPDILSASFHGRDLFAPVAAALALGGRPGDGGVLEAREVARREMVGVDWPAQRAAIVYIDHYGNAMTGLLASAVPAGAVLRVGRHAVHPARTFADVPRRAVLWYGNSNGLVEIACNGGRVDRELGLEVGASVAIA